MFDTIAAISSGVINQPISIIRVSGPDAFTIIQKIFNGKIGSDKTLTYGYIKDHNELVDEVLVAWFKGPNTFTGEDVAEINAHGGVINSNKILELLLTNGARLAENGEFSKRAFLNGKLDLIKADAIHDMIFAKTVAQSKLAVNKFNGETAIFLNELKHDLLTIIATIETNIDYPEYDDVEELTHNSLLPKLNALATKLKTTIKLSEDSRFIAEGIKVAIVGKPNSGKSTLLNALINEKKAIVTSIPGTTRDIVEGEIVLDGVLLKLVDTAGIHKTNNIIEQQGIRKSLEQIKKADLVIHLLDPSSKIDGDDKQIIAASKHKVFLKVFNKNDLKPMEGISIAAKLNKIEPLTKAIKQQIPSINLDEHKMVTNTRQLSLIKQGLINIQQAITNLKANFSPDEVIVDIRLAWENIANISGRADNEDLLDEIFKNFCLGK